LYSPQFIVDPSDLQGQVIAGEQVIGF
jgi:hypothetical protein